MRPWKKALLGCGVAATVLYIALDAIAAVRYRGYSYTGQTISELSAVGAPTRPLWIPVALVYSTLMVAFGAGAWASAGKATALRLVSVIAGAVGAVGIVAWPFAPMHQRAELEQGGGTFAGTMHLVLSMIDTLLFLAAIGIGVATGGRRFRRYSVITLIAVLAGGFLTAVQGGKVARNERTPWMGITERIAVLGSMLWFAVLGVVLWRRASNKAAIPYGSRRGRG